MTNAVQAARANPNEIASNDLFALVDGGKSGLEASLVQSIQTVDGKAIPKGHRKLRLTFSEEAMEKPSQQNRGCCNLEQMTITHLVSNGALKVPKKPRRH